MIIFDKGQLGRIAGEQGFVRDTYEKVLRITEVLRFMNADPLLSGHLVLKGGTAINLLIVDMPRLSVDIDMDVVPDMTKDEMLTLRKDIEETISGYMNAEGYSYSQASRRSYSKVVDLISNDPTISRQKMADEIGMSLAGVKKIIKKLSENGVLHYEGSSKKGHWVIENGVDIFNEGNFPAAK